MAYVGDEEVDRIVGQFTQINDQLPGVEWCGYQLPEPPAPSMDEINRFIYGDEGRSELPTATWHVLWAPEPRTRFQRFRSRLSDAWGVLRGKLDVRDCFDD